MRRRELGWLDWSILDSIQELQLALEKGMPTGRQAGYLMEVR